MMRLWLCFSLCVVIAPVWGLAPSFQSFVEEDFVGVPKNVVCQRIVDPNIEISPQKDKVGKSHGATAIFDLTHPGESRHKEVLTIEYLRTTGSHHQFQVHLRANLGPSLDVDIDGGTLTLPEKWLSQLSSIVVKDFIKAQLRIVANVHADTLDSGETSPVRLMREKKLLQKDLKAKEEAWKKFLKRSARQRTNLLDPSVELPQSAMPSGFKPTVANTVSPEEQALFEVGEKWLEIARIIDENDKQENRFKNGYNEAMWEQVFSLLEDIASLKRRYKLSLTYMDVSVHIVYIRYYISLLKKATQSSAKTDKLELPSIVVQIKQHFKSIQQQSVHVCPKGKYDSALYTNSIGELQAKVQNLVGEQRFYLRAGAPLKALFEADTEPREIIVLQEMAWRNSLLDLFELSEELPVFVKDLFLVLPNTYSLYGRSLHDVLVSTQDTIWIQMGNQGEQVALIEYLFNKKLKILVEKGQTASVADKVKLMPLFAQLLRSYPKGLQGRDEFQAAIALALVKLYSIAMGDPKADYLIAFIQALTEADLAPHQLEAAIKVEAGQAADRMTVTEFFKTIWMQLFKDKAGTSDMARVQKAFVRYLNGYRGQSYVGSLLASILAYQDIEEGQRELNRLDVSATINGKYEALLNSKGFVLARDMNLAVVMGIAFSPEAKQRKLSKNYEAGLKKVMEQTFEHPHFLREAWSLQDGWMLKPFYQVVTLYQKVCTEKLFKQEKMKDKVDRFVDVLMASANSKLKRGYVTDIVRMVAKARGISVMDYLQQRIAERANLGEIIPIVAGFQGIDALSLHGQNLIHKLFFSDYETFGLAVYSLDNWSLVAEQVQLAAARLKAIREGSAWKVIRWINWAWEKIWSGSPESQSMWVYQEMLQHELALRIESLPLKGVGHMKKYQGRFQQVFEWVKQDDVWEDYDAHEKLVYRKPGLREWLGKDVIWVKDPVSLQEYIYWDDEAFTAKHNRTNQLDQQASVLNVAA